MRKLFAGLAVVGVATFVAGPVSATQGAHFMPATDGSVADNGALVITIDEAGLGNALVSYTLDWTAVANYGCINGGGNHPQASNKETVETGAALDFNEQAKNGRVQVTFAVPGTPSSSNARSVARVATAISTRRRWPTYFGVMSVPSAS